MTTEPQAVADFLSTLTLKQRRLVHKLRLLIRRHAPGTTETVVWRSSSYHQPKLGGRVKGAVCLITPRPESIEVGFIHGAALHDPEHLLQGSAKAKRFVCVASTREIRTKALSGLIAAAAALHAGTAAQPSARADRE